MRFYVATLLLIGVLTTISPAYSSPETPKRHSHEHEHHSHEHTETASPHKLGATPLVRSNSEQIWMDTVGAVLCVSVAPFILLFIVPDLNTHQNLLKVLLGFAAGGLLGDAFLHLIPHALSYNSHTEDHDGHNHDHAHSHDLSNHDSRVSLCVIGGIFAFLCIDKFLRLLRPNGHSSHSHAANTGNQVEANSSKKQKNMKAGDSKTSSQVNAPNKAKSKASQGMDTAGYLNLAADFIHNFTDGIAIASSFIIGRNVGFVTTLTVLIHELPHEIGDYAILIKAGCGAYRAMLLQLLTALGALAGASLSLLAAGVGLDAKTSTLLNSSTPYVVLSPEVISTYLLPLIAGGFIYIALVSVMPDLLVENSTAGKPVQAVYKRLGQAFAEIAALCCGVGLMAVITMFE